MTSMASSAAWLGTEATSHPGPRELQLVVAALYDITVDQEHTVVYSTPATVLLGLGRADDANTTNTIIKSNR